MPLLPLIRTAAPVRAPLGLVPVIVLAAACVGGAAPRAVTASPSQLAATSRPSTPGPTTPGLTTPGPTRTPTPDAVSSSRIPSRPASSGRPPAGSVLARFAPGPPVVDRALAALAPGPVLGRRIGYLVVDPYTGAVVASRLGSVPLTPASTSKLLTATALVDRYGPGHRFQTRVVLQAAAAGSPARLVLVGGGDPSLTSVAAPAPGPVGPGSTAVRGPARLPALARLTADALRARGITAIGLNVDDSLFAGPRISAAWPRTDIPEGYVGPVDALAVDGGRVHPASARRVADPALAAGKLFAALLRADGVTVATPVTRAAPATTAGPAIAGVRSPPVSELIHHMLEASDNDYAEVLSRQVAVGTAAPATFAGGVAAVDERLAADGVDVTGLTRYDGSGLSHLDRIEPATLAAVIELDLRTPRLAAVLDAAAVAGRPGSLYLRMGGPHGPAAGRIVAKTGTLTRVHDLAGYVVPKAGRPLIFVFMVDTAHDDLAAEDSLDDAAVRLALAG